MNAEVVDGASRDNRIRIPNGFNPRRVAAQLPDEPYFMEYGQFLSHLASRLEPAASEGNDLAYLYKPTIQPQNLVDHPAVAFLEVPYAVAVGIASGDIPPTNHLNPAHPKNTELRADIAQSLVGLLWCLQAMEEADIEWNGPYRRPTEKGLDHTFYASFGEGEELRIERLYFPEYDRDLITISYFDWNPGLLRHKDMGNTSLAAEIRLENYERNTQLLTYINASKLFWRSSSRTRNKLILDTSIPREELVDIYLAKRYNYVPTLKGDPQDIRSAQRGILDVLGVGQILDLDPYDLYPSL